MTQVIWNADIDVYNPQVIPISVAATIAKYLNVQDLLSFAQVSRNTYKAVTDHRLWVGKLRLMNIWNEPNAFIPSDTRNFHPQNFLQTNFKDPLTCLDRIIKSPKLAKVQVLLIHRALHQFYDDLKSNRLYEMLKVFTNFSTPMQQAKILKNLSTFNNIDVDAESHAMVKDKIGSIFEMFESALLRELEIHFDLQDHAKTREFVAILLLLGNDQTVTDFFLQKTIFDNVDSDVLNPQLFDHGALFQRRNLMDFDDSVTPQQHNWTIQRDGLDQFTTRLATVFNRESSIIDLVFPQLLPIMYKVCEELISNQLTELIMVIVLAAQERNCYLVTMPLLYQALTVGFIAKLQPCANVGPSFLRLVRELIDMLFESFAVDYVRDEGQTFKLFAKRVIEQWRDSISQREQQTVQNILKNVRVETKNDFLSSFKKVFTINAGTLEGATASDDAENYSEIVAKTKILSENIKSLNKIFSIETSMEIIQEAKTCLYRLLAFRDFSIVGVRTEIYAGMQDIFVTLIDNVGNEHVKLGFEKALEYLKTYNPKEKIGEDPLVLFSELINMADLIIQMIDIFYKEEFLSTNIVKVENSILNPSLQHKKKFEAIVDTYVADGLNVGIDLLMDQLEDVFTTELKPEDYNPPAGGQMGPTNAALRVVRILDENMDLLVGCTDKSIVEVFQKEIAERFFQLVVKTLKKSTISVDGSMNLISDLNLYYDFIVSHIRSNKRLVIPFYQALKKVGSIYLISGKDSKSIGKLVSDLSKFNGIFSQEEVYEFVQRRQDWLTIKKDVEKVMYGLSLGDCTII